MQRNDTGSRRIGRVFGVVISFMVIAGVPVAVFAGQASASRECIQVGEGGTQAGFGYQPKLPYQVNETFENYLLYRNRGPSVVNVTSVFLTFGQGLEFDPNPNATTLAIPVEDFILYGGEEKFIPFGFRVGDHVGPGNHTLNVYFERTESYDCGVTWWPRLPAYGLLVFDVLADASHSSVDSSPLQWLSLFLSVASLAGVVALGALLRRRGTL